MGDDSVEWAESWLRQRRSDNRARGRALDENTVITKLLQRPQYVRSVYARISRLTSAPMHREVMLETLLNALVEAASSSSKADKTQQARSEASRLSRKIADGLGKLPKLFEQRSQLMDDYGLGGSEDEHVLDWIEAGLQRSDHETQPARSALRKLLQGYNVRTGQAARLFLMHIGECEGAPTPVSEGSARTPDLRVDLTDEQMANLLTAIDFDVSQDAVKKTRQRLRKQGDISGAER